MQVNKNSRFFRSFMVGLIASGAGAFVALPSAAMPEVTEGVSATDAIDEAVQEVIEVLPTPSADETLPESEEGMVVEAEALETVPAEEATEPAVETAPVVEAPIVEEKPVVEADAVEEKPVVEADVMEEAPVVEADVMEEAPVVEADAMEEAPVVEAEMMEEAPVVEAEGEEINTEEFTIAELAGNSDSFEILAAALAAADLTEVLAADGPYTVFAPTDEAFEALPEGAVEQLLLPENKDVLAQVLAYHVVPGTLLAADLESGNVSTVEGSDIAVEVTETAVTVDNANVLVTDVEASNGVIHVIDRVIIPPTPAEEGAE